MAMNMEALKAAQKKLEDRNNGGGAFISTKDINADTGLTIRLLEPPIELGGNFFYEVIRYWLNVNGKRKCVTCSSTFGKKSVIEEEIAIARNSDNDDVLAVLDDQDNKTAISKVSEAWMACLQISGYTYDKTDSTVITGAIIEDNMPKIFQCGKLTLTNKIMKIATSGKNTRLTKQQGIWDRKLGVNILCTKTGTQKATRYDAESEEQIEMPLSCYPDNVNVLEIAKLMTPSMAYQRATIRNHIYGEEIPEEVQAKEDERTEKAKAVMAKIFKPFAPSKKKAATEDDEDEAPKKSAKPKKPVADEDDEDEEPAKPVKKSAKKPVDDEDEDEDETPKKKVAKKKAVVEDDEDEEPEEDELPAQKKSAKKPVVEDDEDEDETPAPKKDKTAAPKKSFLDDDDEEDEAPAPKKSAKAKPAPIQDEDEDEDAPKPVAKKRVAPAPPPAKKAVAKKSILDDLDLDDDDDDDDDE